MRDRAGVPVLAPRRLYPPAGGLDRAFEEDGSGNRKGKREKHARRREEDWHTRDAAGTEWMVVRVVDGRSGDAVFTGGGGVAGTVRATGDVGGRWQNV